MTFPRSTTRTALLNYSNDRRLFLAAGVALLVFVAALASVASPAQAEAAAGAASDLMFAFKLDPRLNGGTYGGARWVARPTYTGATGQSTVDARVLAIDTQRRPVTISPEWTSSAPDVVAVSPGRGSRVTITVKRAGESRLQVTVPGISKELLVTAEGTGQFLQVEIVQAASDAGRESD